MSKFIQALTNSKEGSLPIIAEIKLASPTEKRLGNKSEIITRAKQYEQAGATAISVITEKKIFKGDPKFITEIKKFVSLPILQKDFILNSNQVYQSKKIGADALLLIAKILSKKELIVLVNLVKKIGLEPVVEINSIDDLGKAVSTRTNIIAVNARDLDTLSVDVDKACTLLKKVPDKFIKLGFSGVQTRIEIEKYKLAGAKAVLVGTQLMKTKNIKKFISDLRIPAKIKICGIRTVDAAKISVDAGADFLGFNFVPSSKRYISPADALKIINTVIGKVKIVGIFQDADINLVNNLSSNLELDFVQLHDTQDNQYIKPVIKAIGIDDDPNNYCADYYLLDRPGRTGQIIDLNKAAQLAQEFPIFFAGGLTPSNVVKVIRKVKPFAVDVASGIETNGYQDEEKIKLFIRNAKGAVL